MPNFSYGRTGWRLYLNQGGAITLMVHDDDGEMEMCVLPPDVGLLEEIGKAFVKLSDDLRWSKRGNQGE